MAVNLCMAHLAITRTLSQDLCAQQVDAIEIEGAVQPDPRTRYR